MFDPQKLQEGLVGLARSNLPSDQMATRLTEMAKNIRLESNVGDYYTTKDVRQKLKVILSHVQYALSHQTSFESGLVNNIEAIRGEFRDVTNWVIIVPLENLGIIKSSVFRIGEVDFYRFDRVRKAKLVKILKRVLWPNPDHPIDEKQSFLTITEKSLESLLDRTVGEVNLRGAPDDVTLAAIERVEVGLDCLKLYRSWTDELRGSNFGIVGRVFPSQTRQIIRYRADKMAFYPQWERVGGFFPYQLDKSRLQSMQRGGFILLRAFLKKESQNDIESRILTAIRFYAKAGEVPASSTRQVKKDKPPSSIEQIWFGEKLVLLFMSLESLFVLDSGEPIQSNAFDRVALCLGTDFDSRIRVISDLRKLYKYRSAVVHHGRSHDVKLADIQYLTEIVGSSIIRVLRNYRRLDISDDNDFRHVFEYQKFHGRRFWI